MSFGPGATAQVIAKVDAGVVDQDIERFDLLNSSLNLPLVGYVERQWGYAFIGDRASAACSRVDSFRSAPKRLMDQRQPVVLPANLDSQGLVF
ncbi:MAG: hypothetical protein WBE86_00505 [Candidatus Acidiferrales bacterium]